jgi:WD repeat-containing protein 24
MAHSAEHKSSVGRGGYRIDASRNLWTSSGLKIDSASTDVVWGHGSTLVHFHIPRKSLATIDFSNKILTSARNGELIMWDLNKSGPTKYGEFAFRTVRACN